MLSPPSTLLLSHLSRLLGWTYTLLWSLSFYPQVITNHVHKSVRGLSFDYLLLNLLGHSSYALYNLLFLVFPVIQQEYRDKWGSENVVQWNDAAFSVHAALISAVTVGQWCKYRTPPTLPPVPRSRPSNRYEAIAAEETQQASIDGGERVSRPANLFLVAALTVLILSLGLLNIGSIQPLLFVDILAYIKLAVTLVKYLPQIRLNYTRKSTKGFNVENVLLDASGGVLSLAQLVLDAVRMGGDWKGAIGDIGKLGLSLLSIAYDVILMVQHYLIYPSSSTNSGQGTFSFLFSSSSPRQDAERGMERQPLLRGDTDDEGRQREGSI